MYSSRTNPVKGDALTSSTRPNRVPAVLVLADGRVFRGYSFGAARTTFGEAVFTTAMTGYQETMTDPSYHRQIVVATAPQIGNTGWNDEDSESYDERIWVAGLVIRDLAHRVSNWRAQRTLTAEMEAQDVVGIQGVDTRALVRHLRDHGAMGAGIFIGDQATAPVEKLVAEVAAQPSMAGADLSAEVSTDVVYEVPAQGEQKYTIVAYDLGIKSATPNNFAKRGIRSIVVPANTPFEELAQYHPDGVFFSNGPGDPATADKMVEVARKVIEAKIPLFGICFGNQILGRALGLGTFKLKFGHRGINVPVINKVTGKIDITSQNHGFALETPAGESFETDFGPARVTHVCLNDQTVEGVALDNGMAFSVQYHPESAAGPHDASPLFDQFIALMDESAK
ncbi:glutamine-hydrolyzing carbamoyl-phosphate synthase small subunit [Corynebacterium alimapuense]|uniref:Carbamoyl phosphate synthase small chain n=1 Tax=Corynebacterium alimapuense TaxID=1576874 RepID=A0A3M8K7M9_9CORY|nr:glutamine-hydrolyzing carbamoyl-phosphate synthase small subunit [Corynebacterium alimapuense]RNE49223.1 carbamoyl phosphate synthase small subunit [Corynebacterium alimapuense]